MSQTLSNPNPNPNPNPPAAAAPRTPWALVSLALSLLLASLGTSSANVGLPALAQAFSAPFPQVQWIVLAYLLAITVCVVGAGRLGDQWGRKRLLLAGIAVFTLGSALCGLAPTLGLLIAARAVQGAGAAVMMALSMAFVGDILPKHRTGSAMGLLGTMSAVGTALGPTLGGVLIAALGWRFLFLANLPLGLLGIILVARFLPADRPRTSGAGFDVAGTMLLGVTLAAYALAMTLGRGQFGALNIALLLAAVAGVGLFLRVESRVPAPLVRLAMLRERGLGAGLAMNALVSTVMMATLVVGPFYLTQALGLGAAEAGLVMSVGPLISAVCGVPAGRLVDRLGAARIARLGLAAMVLGAALLAALPATLGVAGYLGPIVVLTIGYAVFQAANNTGVMADVDARQRGLVSGMLSLSRNLGLVTGASAMGAVFALAAGAVDLTAAAPGAVARGMGVAFGMAAALAACAWGIGGRQRRG
ncbi:MFS transporter [Achromobacter sp. DH1f]|uniref:MFS transporter n=1 Tax=Achromobacter sp. DH1f TaxID=1397275 RepID=UPI0004690268|nr:MFS transporter [Achromobacter sp. DH1f]